MKELKTITALIVMIDLLKHIFNIEEQELE